jgi:glycine cleavage system H protein
MSKVPDELKYTKEHEWVRVEGQTAVVGITDHAQQQLGDIVYVELPKVGAAVAQLKPFGTIESVKAASDLYSPLTGKVAAVNGDLEKHPEAINQDPYGRGWMVRLEPADPAEAQKLLDAAQYRKLL